VRIRRLEQDRRWPVACSALSRRAGSLHDHYQGLAKGGCSGTPMSRR
jgi:hypothetical protein